MWTSITTEHHDIAILNSITAETSTLISQIFKLQNKKIQFSTGDNADQCDNAISNSVNAEDRDTAISTIVTVVN